MKRLQGGLVLVALLAAVAATPAAAAHPEIDWYGRGGCAVPVVGMPTDFDAVAPFIPPEEEKRVITVGAGEERQAGLIFVLIRCPENLLETPTSSLWRDDVVQVMAGVLYESGRPEDANKAQFYLLSSTTNWGAFTQAENRLDLPSEFSPGAALTVVRDPATGLGVFEGAVPGGVAEMSVSGQILAPNPVRELPQDALHFYRGASGLVRVHHDESWAPANEAVATVTAPAGSLVAGWMGATSREATGIYVWIDDVDHVHRYRVIE